MGKVQNPTTPRVVIIGAGCGGVIAAITLKKHGYINFTVYERGPEVGGTWRENIYPGCSSDIPMHMYSYSGDLHNWSRSHAAQEEILDYWVSVASRHDLYPSMELNHKVISAEWNNAAQHYTVVAENTLTGQQTTSIAHVVISAVGILDTPRFARIPGVGSFKGEMFHSARWDKTVDLRGKRVGVVGNGASATQFVPKIVEDPEVKVLQFIRTPTWLIPDLKKKYSPLRMWLQGNVPFVLRIIRWSIFLRLELIYQIIWANGLTRWFMMKALSSYIRDAAPAEYREKLIPTFPLGCKRVLFDTGYLKALHQPNVDINWDGIEKVVEDGVITEAGEHIPLDVIIFATGFATDVYPITVRGSRNTTIQEYYEEEKGTKAYLGTAAPGFPNFFTLFGPNVSTGHTSVIFTNETQMDYVMQVIKPILDGEVKSFEVKPEPTNAYDAKVQASIAKSVFTGCHSWYRIGGVGKITNVFPESGFTFMRWLSKPNWAHYSGVGADAWLAKRRRLDTLKRAFKTLVLLGLLGGIVAKRFPVWPDFLAQMVARTFAGL